MQLGATCSTGSSNKNSPETSNNLLAVIMSTSATFGWYDYLLFASILAISLAIGLGLGLAGGRQKTTKEYLLANRNLGEYTFCIFFL